MPRETLTKNQIVRAAIELLDAEGLEGLNMRSLGQRLGSAATAVYWHVKSKDDLVMLAGDEVWNEIELPDLDAVDWRTTATAMATSLSAMITRHWWLVQAFGSYPLYGPGKARHDDHLLAIYEKAGFVGAEVEQAVATVFMFVLGSALGTSATAALTRRLSRAGGDPEKELRDVMAKASEIAMQFPRLRARVEQGPDVEYGDAPEKSFEFGLRAVLDGLDARLAGRRPPTGPEPN
ncbi:MAG TPA: TetR/AcrR family transcriptional regulator [Actinomycetes bacterium]|nr:TetR/AcrR family transcriptional regulator [Actinomycetes bacterium]